jgi:hypothetical protein
MILVDRAGFMKHMLDQAPSLKRSKSAVSRRWCAARMRSTRSSCRSRARNSPSTTDPAVVAARASQYATILATTRPETLPGTSTTRSPAAAASTTSPDRCRARGAGTASLTPSKHRSTMTPPSSSGFSSIVVAAATAVAREACSVAREKGLAPGQVIEGSEDCFYRVETWWTELYGPRPPWPFLPNKKKLQPTSK